MVTEEMFKEYKLLKDNSIELPALLKYVETQVKEPDWVPIFKSACEQCHKDITAKKDEIIKELEKDPFNIPKEKCNSTYMSMVTCIHLEGFAVRNVVFFIKKN